MISNQASAPAPFRRHLCCAYTITHSKYRGHRWRRVDDAAHSAVQPPQGPHTLLLSFFLSFRTLLSGSPFKETDHRTHHRRENQGGKRLCTQGNTQVVSVNDRYTCFTYPHAACPWIGHAKWSYLFSLNALIVNIRLDVLYK